VVAGRYRSREQRHDQDVSSRAFDTILVLVPQK
jgi:hypothetical protein